MSESARIVSMEPDRRGSFPELGWQDVNEPGAYVEKHTGHLYRIPKEALVEGSSPMIRKESLDGAKLVRISSNPFITTFEARMLACEQNVQPNF